MKKLMNKRDVVRYHKFLDEGLSVKEISGIMKTEVQCLESFAPANVVKSKDAKAKVAVKAAAKEDKPTAKVAAKVA